MRQLWPLGLVLCTSACSNLIGIGEFHLADAGDDAMTCTGTGLIQICPAVAPSTPLSLNGSLDTDTDPRCAFVTQPQGPVVCLISGTDIQVGSVTAIGSHPLVLAATSNIAISGTLDVSSTGSPSRTGAGANDPGCAGQAGQSISTGAGGGAGGGLGATGSNGGNSRPGSGMGGTAAQPPMIVAVRGGCAGGRGGTGQGTTSGGTAGSSGGAVYLIASGTMSIAASGAIFASGAGGGPGNPSNNDNVGGGGGGGSGGIIGLEAPMIMIDGIVAANGGGGGGGGDCCAGFPGRDGTTSNWNVPAAGGPNEGASHGGAGGAGGALTIAAMPGLQPSGGGGGGGGGGTVGVVWVKGSLSGTKISPAPQMH